MQCLRVADPPRKRPHPSSFPTQSEGENANEHRRANVRSANDKVSTGLALVTDTDVVTAPTPPLTLNHFSPPRAEQLAKRWKASGVEELACDKEGVRKTTSTSSDGDGRREDALGSEQAGSGAEQAGSGSLRLASSPPVHLSTESGKAPGTHGKGEKARRREEQREPILAPQIQILVPFFCPAHWKHVLWQYARVIL